MPSALVWLLFGGSFTIGVFWQGFKLVQNKASDGSWLLFGTMVFYALCCIAGAAGAMIGHRTSTKPPSA